MKLTDRHREAIIKNVRDALYSGSLKTLKVENGISKTNPQEAFLNIEIITVPKLDKKQINQ